MAYYKNRRNGDTYTKKEDADRVHESGDIIEVWGMSPLLGRDIMTCVWYPKGKVVFCDAHGKENEQ